MRVTKKELKELIKNPSFDSFIYIWYNKTKDKYNWIDRVDSRDVWVDRVLKDINNTKIKTYHIYCDYLTKEEKLKKDIRELIVEPKEKSVVKYKWNYNSECKCKDCQEKFWPKGCGFNIEGSKQQALDKNESFIYWHNILISKTYNFKKWFEGFEVLDIANDNFLIDKVVNWIRVLKFGLQFTEFGGLKVDKNQKDELIEFLNSCGWVEFIL